MAVYLPMLSLSADPYGPLHLQHTVSGCVCKSTCGATVDFKEASVDWCYTDGFASGEKGSCGHYAITRASYYDYCVYPEDGAYEEQTAQAKQAWLWSQVEQSVTSSPSMWPSQAGIFTESVVTSFTNHADVMPKGRERLIHSIGAVAQVEFISSGSHPYTGVFKGARFGLLRLSTAKAVDKKSITPGFGLKLLRDGVTSANLVAMPSLDGQSDFNIARFNYTTGITATNSFALKLVAKKFTQGSNCPLMVGLSDFATKGADGKAAAAPKSPWELSFVPRFDAFPSAPYSGDDFLHYLENNIAPNTTLFDVFAQPTPAARYPPGSGKASVSPVHFLGSLRSNSAFKSSTFGDESAGETCAPFWRPAICACHADASPLCLDLGDKGIFFRHTLLEDDIKANPEWLNAMEDLGLKDLCGIEGLSADPPFQGKVPEAVRCPVTGMAAEDVEGGCPTAPPPDLLLLEACRRSQAGWAR